VSVGPEAEPADLVIVEFRLVDREDQRGTRRVGNVRVRRRDVIAADFRIAGVFIAESDVEIAVGGEIGIEGEAEQTALAVIKRDLAGHIEKRRRQNLPGGKIDDVDGPQSLDDEQATGIAGRRAGEQRLAEKRPYLRREDIAG